jgi:pyridoxal phosphate enzyme (YggS family)
MTIADNIRAVREQIAEAAVASGRRPEDIMLVAATKMNDAARVREAIAAGVDAVGENRVQEMLEKREKGAYLGAPLHFIGHLQTNKVRQVVGVCDMIQSVDSVALIELIGKRALSMGLRQDILLEVNIGKEAGKSGVYSEDIGRILDAAASSGGVRVLGLMAIPPVTETGSESRYYFDSLYNLFVDIRGKRYDNISMNFLSMGMSDTYAEAIRAGANIVRVGSAIFGQRHY